MRKVRFVLMRRKVGVRTEDVWGRFFLRLSSRPGKPHSGRVVALLRTARVIPTSGNLAPQIVQAGAGGLVYFHPQACRRRFFLLEWSREKMLPGSGIIVGSGATPRSSATRFTMSDCGASSAVPDAGSTLLLLGSGLAALLFFSGRFFSAAQELGCGRATC